MRGLAGVWKAFVTVGEAIDVVMIVDDYERTYTIQSAKHRRRNEYIILTKEQEREALRQLEL